MLQEHIWLKVRKKRGHYNNIIRMGRYWFMLNAVELTYFFLMTIQVLKSVTLDCALIGCILLLLSSIRKEP